MKTKTTKIIEDFNRIRSPEINAKLISDSNDMITIEFTGSFCHTCGFLDYFDDFRYELVDSGIKTKIGEIKTENNKTTVHFLLI